MPLRLHFAARNIVMIIVHNEDDNEDREDRGWLGCVIEGERGRCITGE